MRTKVADISEFKPAPFEELIEQLYQSPFKPRLSNTQAATRVITVTEEEQLLGFIFCYLSPSHPQHLILGNFECTNSSKVARKLFDEAKAVASQNNRAFLLGPMNGSTWFTYRFSLTGQTPFFMETIHKPYYVDLWESCGFRVKESYQTNIEDFSANTPSPDVQAYLSKNQLTIRKFNKRSAIDELKILHSFCMQLFAENVLFSPISEEEFIALYQPILPYLDEDLIEFVQDKDEIVGLFFTVKNHYNPEQVIVKTVARNPDSKYKGLGHIMAANFCQNAIAMGYKSMLNAYFHLDNKSAILSRNYGGSLLQKHALYQLNL
jgi:hypothetical protein